MISPLFTQTLTSIGTVVALKSACDFTSFLYFHLLSPSTYSRFLHGRAPYALVTGASDGIGKAVAKELYAKGFNVIIHGRSAEKLKKVQEEIQSSSNVERDVRLWVANARAPDVDLVQALKDWSDIEITLVIHNVGGAQLTNARYALAFDSFISILSFCFLLPLLPHLASTQSQKKSSSATCA